MTRKLYQELLSDNMPDVTSLIIYLVILGVLAIAFLCCFPFYLKASTKNAAAHEMSPLSPLFMCSYRTIKFVYPIFFLFSAFGGSFLGIVIDMCVATYQISISLFSIHRFFNDRRPVEMRKNLTSKNVTTTLAITFSIIFVKELGTIIIAIMIVLNGPSKIGSFLVIYCLATYIPYQILLFVAMALQFCMEPSTSHSENIVAANTKIIGATKIVLHLITGLCCATGFLATASLLLFFSIDVFLVPLVIEITEIFVTPNEIQQSNDASVPREII
ncbi:unnamed protein product [Caenorhabditis brenneri]